MKTRLPFRCPPLWLGLLLLLTAGACKTGDTVNAKKCLLRSADWTYTGPTITYTYGGTFEYNAGRQLTKATFKSNNAFLGTNEVQEFTYSPTQIEMKVNPAPTSAKGGDLSATYLLNSAGYVTKIATVSWKSGSGSTAQQITQNQFFEYNAEGRLSKTTDYDGSYTTLEYNNGNLSVGRRYASGGTLTSTDAYTLYTDKTGSVAGGADVFGAFYAQGLFGKPVQNPIKSVVRTKGTTTTIDNTSTYTYAFDADNNIVSSVQTTKAGTSTTTDTFTTNYTYLCQ